MDELEKLRKIVASMRPPYVSEDGAEYYEGMFYYPEFSNVLLYDAFKEILRILTLSTKQPKEEKLDDG